MENNISNYDEFTMGVDGDVINYDAVSSSQNIGGTYGQFREDLSLGDDDEFYGGDGDYSNAGGLLKNFRKNQAKRQKRRDLKVKSKADARKTKADARVQKAKASQIQAKAQVESAKASKEGAKTDLAMAEALKSTAPPIEEPKKGLSMGAKIGIGVGVAVVLGVVGFIIYKKMKGNKAGK
jgi:Sec-independent protein translocase protein TatA